MPVVMKFGGTSVADAAAFENVARIVATQRDAVVVVSAMSGVTDSLLAATSIEDLENVFEIFDAGRGEQTVGDATHRGDDHDSVTLSRNDARNVLKRGGVRDGRAAKFHHDWH